MRFIQLLIIVLVLSSCAGVDYFKQPENQQVLVDLGISCIAEKPESAKIGALYVLDTRFQDNSLMEFVVGCDYKLYTVTCDVSKKAACSDLKVYTGE